MRNGFVCPLQLHRQPSGGLVQFEALRKSLQPLDVPAVGHETSSFELVVGTRREDIGLRS